MLIHMRPELIGYLADSYINGITSKKIHVISSHHPEYALSDDLSAGIVVMAKEISSFSRMAVLENNGDFYNLKINASYVCVKDDTLIKCRDPALFGLSESKYGYKLTYHDRCLTISSRLLFADCDKDNKNQDLAFVDKSAFYCKEEQLPPEDESERGKATSPAAVDKKLAKEFEKHGIKNKDIQKTLKKMWKWNLGFWPRFSLCSI